MKFAGISLGLATIQPARLLSIADERGRLCEGARADLLTFRWDASASCLDLLSTVLNGEVVYKA